MEEELHGQKREAMKRWVLCSVIIFLTHIVWAQEELLLEALHALDSITSPILSTQNIKMQEDSVMFEAVLASDLEYVPAEESAELLPDRLSCLQEKITLEYND